MDNQKLWALTRLVVLLFTMINSWLAHKGFNLIKTDDEQVYQYISDLFLLGSVIWSYWKNNDLTDEAVKGTQLMRELKEEKGDDENANY